MILKQARAELRPESKKTDLESERSRLETRIKEVFDQIDTRARTISERLFVAYNKIDSPDIDELKKAASQNHESFLKINETNHNKFLEFVSMAASTEDIEMIEQRLEQEMASSMVILDSAEAQLKELESVAEGQAANKLVDRFIGDGIREPTEEELADMPEMVRNTVLAEMSKLDEEAIGFEEQSEARVSQLKDRFNKIKTKVGDKVNPQTISQIEEYFGSLTKFIETHKSLSDEERRSINTQEQRLNFNRILDKLESLIVSCGY